VITIQKLYQKFEYIQSAEMLWSKKCREFLTQYGDIGTETRLAGIYTLYKPVNGEMFQKIIIAANSVTTAKRSFVWEESVGEIVDFLKRNIGKHFYYNPGTEVNYLMERSS